MKSLTFNKKHSAISSMQTTCFAFASKDTKGRGGEERTNERGNYFFRIQNVVNISVMSTMDETTGFNIKGVARGNKPPKLKFSFSRQQSILGQIQLFCFCGAQGNVSTKPMKRLKPHFARSAEHQSAPGQS